MAAAIARALPVMRATREKPDADMRARLRRLVDEVFPRDAEQYVALIGGLMAEQRRHPELIRAFRETILLPRRAIVRAVIEQAQRTGDVRADIDPEYALDLIGGPFLARVFAGLDVSRRWRDDAFALWWSAVRAP